MPLFIKKDLHPQTPNTNTLAHSPQTYPNIRRNTSTASVNYVH